MCHSIRWPLLTAAALLACPAVAPATKFVEPKRRDVFSRNGAFVLDVDPQSERHTVYAVRDRTKPLWSFSLPVWHFPLLLSDDGTVVAVVSWRYVQAEDIADSPGVGFWNKQGMFRGYSLVELCSWPRRTWDDGPIGSFWRTWYTEVNDEGNSFTLRTTRGMQYRFRYSDGEIVARRRSQWLHWEEWLVVGALALVVLTCALWWRRRRHRSIQPNPREWLKGP